MLLTLMMLPLPLAAIPGANAATRKNAARTLLANSASNVSTLRSGVAPNQENPALLTRMSISPTALTRRWRSAGSLRSAPTKRAWPPAAVIASTVSAPRAASRPWTMTSAPSRASCKATARPIPDVARSEEHTSELQSRLHLVCRLLLEKKKHRHRLHALHVGFQPPRDRAFGPDHAIVGDRDDAPDLHQRASFASASRASPLPRHPVHSSI